jgi:triacylglycerol lipase
MNLPTLIDVAIGLVLVFFLLATIGSLLAEFWAAYRKLRHRLLRDTVNRLLGAKIAAEFWRHSLILPLYEPPPPEDETDADEAKGWPAKIKKALRIAARIALKYGLKLPWSTLGPRRAEAPAYLDMQLFAATVLDIATGKGARGRIPNDITVWRHTIEETIEDLPGPDNDLQDHLLALLRQVPADTVDVAAALKSAVARWYEEAMQRASGTYRRQTQKSLLGIGALLALALNVDALRIAQVLYQNPQLRKDIAAQAEQIVKDRTDADGKLKPIANDAAARQQLQAYSGELRDMVKVGFPLGWMPVWRENFIRVPEASSPATALAPAPAAPTDAPPASKFRRFWRDFAAPGWVAFLAKFAGLAASALAVCLGAPFWFDVLGRLVKLRTSAGAAAEKPKEAAASSATPGAVAPTATTAATPVAPATTTPLPTALDALAAPGIEFDVARSSWLAKFADRAYETDRDAVRRWLGEIGFELAQSFDTQGTQGFLAVSATSAVLVFRGTEKKLEDWVSDAKFELVDYGEFNVPGRVHHGFKEALGFVTAQVDAALGKLRGRRGLLHVTGHSLGAALATLAALRCAHRQETADLLHSLHTFGSPRVGDAPFAAAFSSRLGERTFRIVNNEDLVTRVPTRAQGYEHVGKLIYIDEAGRLQRDIGYWYRFLNFATNALGDLQQAVGTTVKDHSMKLYCGHLEKSARHPH